MKLEHQVCTLEQAKKLKELGVLQQSIWYWQKMKEPVIEGCSNLRLQLFADVHHPISSSVVEKNYSAFSSAELGAMLPDDEAFDINTFLNNRTLQWYCAVLKRDDEDSELEYDWIFDGVGNTDAEARANALISLLEKNLINVEDVNARLMQSEDNVQVSDTTGADHGPAAGSS
jgi:hypothetical protein